MGSPLYSYSMAEHRQEPFVILGEVEGRFADGIVVYSVFAKVSKIDG